MAILAGIDEAGYGPLLGPLVVTGVAFHVPDDAVDDCLWRRLSRSVSCHTGKHDHRLPIADSKKLFRTKTGLKTLERTALATASTAGIVSTAGRRWLQRIAPACVDSLRRYPWYADYEWSLPLENDATDIAVAANAVKRDMADRRVRLLGVRCEVLCAGEFNRLVSATRNKSVASLGQVLRIVDRVLSVADREPVRVCVDRQGGRQHYGASLMTAFARHDLRIDTESEDLSIYRLDDGDRPVRIEFRTSGEDVHLPVALASVFSKYVRELFMIALNAYWADRVEGLRRTAGYYQDAKRFLGDIAPALRRTGCGTELLVRSR